MDYRIIWSPEAISHLEQVVQFIAFDNADAARNLGNSIIAKTSSLAACPRLGKVFRKLGNENVRELSVPPYRLFHEINDREKQVEILAVWHGARQEPELS